MNKPHAKLQYAPLDSIDPERFIPLLNSQRVRSHLIAHPPFDIESVSAWIQAKCVINNEAGCRIRVVLLDGELAGWCGIQRDGEEYEIAIVLDEKFWGLGKRIFADLQCWAKQLGHAEVQIHLLDTRREYRLLKKIAKRVSTSELLGHRFTTYLIAIE